MPPVRSRLAVVALLLLVACPGPGASTSDDSQSDTATQNTSESTGTTQGCSIGSEGCSCTSGTGTTTGTGETSTGTDTGSTGTGETLGPACTATGDGKESPACVSVDPTRPFCVDDTCVACGALPADACMLGTGGQRPLCLESGACGQCNTATAVEEGQCTAESPHCNLDTNMCEGCFEHSECPATACKIAARKCFPPDNIIYVRQGSPKLPCSDKPGMGGGKDKPYCDFELATAAAQLEGFNSDYTFIALGNEDALGEGMSAVNIAGGDGSPSYAFVHEIGGLYDKHTQFVGIGPMITVPSKITLYIKNFGVVVKGGVGDSSVGVSCSGGEVWLDDSRVLNGRGPNIRSTDCDIHLRRTSVAFGQTEGVDLNGGSLRAVNSFISSNSAKDGFGGGGLHLRNGATIDMLYSTIADNSNEPNKGLGDSIHCDAPSTIKLRNSILANPNVGSNARNCVVSTNNGGSVSQSGSGNLMEAPGVANGPFLPCAGLAQTGDPHFDFDMSERNTVDAGLDYAGADVLAN